MSDRIADLWGTLTPFGRGGEWPVRVDLILEEGVVEQDVDRWSQTASMLHSNGDTRDVAVKDGRVVGLALTDAVLLLLRSSLPGGRDHPDSEPRILADTARDGRADGRGRLAHHRQWSINRDSGVPVPVWGAAG